MMRCALSPSPGAPAKELPWEEAKKRLNDADATVWVDVIHASKEELDELERTFDLHALTVEDLIHRNQRAKVEEYSSYLFVVMHWFAAHNSKRPCELHCILTPRCLVTVTDCAHEKLDKAPPVDAAWARFLAGSSRGPSGADGAMYRVLDELVDTHVPRVNEIEEDIEAVNERVIQGEEGGPIVQELVAQRRRLVILRRVLAPERDVLGALARRNYAWIEEKTALFFRDVQDHLNRTYEMIESLRELDEMVMDVQLALAESRRSVIIKRLTIVSTIFLPISFLASFFGMNFTKIPFDSYDLMYACFAAMITLPAILMAWLSLKRWV